MSLLEEIQGGRMKGRGGREVEEDHGGCSKRVLDEEQNTEGVERQDGRSKKRRIRSENWSARETWQMLELRKAVVQTSVSKGSDAWKQIAQQLADMNPESQARSSKQVAQRWDTLVKLYVSIEEECCESGRIYGEVIDERQKRCKTEYRQTWHELIAQGNPGKRRSSGKVVPVRADEAPGSLANIGASQAVTTIVQKFGEIAKSFTEMLDTIDRSMSSSEEIRNEDFGQANENIVTDCNWEPEDDEGPELTVSVGGLTKQQDKTKAEVARATQSMIESMQSISKGAFASESFCLEVDHKDWSMVIQGLSAISQRFQAISEEGIREEVGTDVLTNSAARSTDDHNNLTQRTSLLTPSIYTKIRKRTEDSLSGKRNAGSTPSPATSTATFTGLSDLMPLSPKSDWDSVSELRKVWSEAVGPRDNDEAKDEPSGPTTERQALIPEPRDVDGELGLRPEPVLRSYDHTNNSIQRSLSLTSSFYISKRSKRTSLSPSNTKRSEKSCSSGKRNGDSTASPATSTATFAGLPDMVHLSPKSDRTNLHRKNTSTTSIKTRFGPRVQGLEEQKNPVE